MKRIMLLTSLAGPEGCMAPGEHEVSDKLARDLVAQGYAKILESALKEEAPKPEPPEVETAEEVQEKREEAVGDAPVPRRGRRRGGR